MQDTIKALRLDAIEELTAISDEETLEQFRIKYLGRKGLLTQLLKGLSSLPSEERPKVGESANILKDELEKRIAQLRGSFDKAQREAEKGKVSIDVTLPGRGVSPGCIHPITKVLNEIIHVFISMGFEVSEGPEVELDFYNFEALNISKEHPARDLHDTFYISDNILLRTHTSPVQIRIMELQTPPVKIIAPGKVYRRDLDVSHTPMFHQVEGLLVDRGITFSHLKGVLTEFIHHVFGNETDLRFRPSYFPFTEPSAEVDIRCVICKGGGCRVCGNTGWIEILGSGMVDPEVFKVVGYDSEEYSGFAFGMGIERITMLKYGIDDIRLFFENDIRFLRQF